MRFAALNLCLLAVIAPISRAADISFVRVWPEWREADSFMSISEYITGREATGGWTIFRTHKDSRTGFYFLARIRNPGPEARGGTLFLQVITPDSAFPKVFSFPADIPKGEHVFELGLTDGDWRGKRVHPVAWKVELRDPGGRTLAGKASFLWEKPE